jgi:hypothetical protein
MSRLLAELLGADKRSYDKIVYRLEHITLRPGVDTRLTAEIITQTREKSRRIGLDPADSTARELYYALLSKADRDGECLRKKLHIDDQTKPAEAARIIAAESQKLINKDIVICLQPATVKKILKAVPPKKTMRALKFRSIESVLKREDPLALYALAKRFEGDSWHSQIQARLKRLQARDVHEHAAQVLSLPEEWLIKLSNYSYDTVLQSVPETGTILLLPSIPLKTRGSVLLTVSLVLQAAQRLSIESLRFRTRSLSVGVESLLPEIAAGLLTELDPIHGLTPSWSSVYQLLAEQSKYRLPDFEFILSDLSWESTETRLASLSPELDFWVNSHYLGFSNSDELPISMHVVDVAASLVLDRSYGEHVVSHMRTSLWNEFQLRYMKHQALEDAVVSQLTVAQGIIL